MTATPTFRASRGHYRFRQVVAMEWIKLRTLRSTWWTLAVTAGGAIAMAVVIGLNTKNGSGDLTNNAPWPASSPDCCSAACSGSWS